MKKIVMVMKSKLTVIWGYIRNHPATFLTILLIVIQVQMNKITDEMRKINEKAYQSENQRIIYEFLSQDMANVREKCTDFKDKFYKDEKYKAKLKYIFEREIMDDKYDNSEWEKFRNDNDILLQEYKALIRFLRYFESISFQELSEANVKTAHFYYTWWRSFMKDIIEVYNEVWIINKDKSKLSFKPHWADDLTNNLDAKMIKYNLPLK
jgi:hypothetical protein